MFHFGLRSVAVVTGGVLFGMILFQVTTKNGLAFLLPALDNILVSEK
jgi:hypothetical protein